MTKMAYLYISEELRKLGIDPALVGYVYLKDAIWKVCEDPSAIGAIMERIYGGLGEKYDKSPQTIERCIRHSIERACFEYRTSDFVGLFEPFLDNQGKVRNNTFIALVADRVKQRLISEGHLEVEDLGTK